MKLIYQIEATSRTTKNQTINTVVSFYTTRGKALNARADLRKAGYEVGPIETVRVETSYRVGVAETQKLIPHG